MTAGSSKRSIRSILFLSCIALSNAVAVAQTSVEVSTEAQLRSALASANAAGGGRTILLADGTYTLTDTLYVDAPNITLAGKSGDRTRVIVQGDGMSSSANVGNVLRVSARSFQLRDMTLQRSRWHLVQIVGENDADAPILRNCILRDAYEQMVKVTIDTSNRSVTSDDGLVENCIFEYTAGIGPQYYIGGIDAHGAKRWTIRNNTFRSIISPSGETAEFAVHFWNGSADNLVERNVIVNCDRGIGFGMQSNPNSGGIIRNNMIFHAGVGSFADTSIALAESPNTQVYNNTIFMEGAFPWAIEYRFSSTQNVLIANNLTNKAISARDGAGGTLSANVVTAQRNWFVNPAAGDLHLTSAVSAVVDKGQSVSGLTTDIDGQSRPQGGGIDIGADEFGAVSKIPMPPADVRAL